MNWHTKPFNQLTAKELYDILHLRNLVFVVEQNCAYLDTDGKDFKALHLYGEQNGEVVAYARLLPPGVSYAEASIGRVVSHSTYRRGGFGKALMKKAIEQIRLQYDVSTIRISAQTYLQRFYESFGFVKVSEEYLEDDIPHIEMLLS